MDIKTKMFWTTTVILLLLLFVLVFYFLFYKKNHMIQARVDCDPYGEPCFVRNCDPLSRQKDRLCTGDPDKDTRYYKIIHKNSNKISSCDVNKEECEPLFCGENEPDCGFVFCNEDNKDKYRADFCNNPMMYRVANPKAPDISCENRECGDANNDENWEDDMVQTTRDEILSEKDGFDNKNGDNAGNFPVVPEE